MFPVENVTAFVLAGGKSSRMGSDKALLTVGEQTLLTQALRTASAAANTVRISGSKERYGKSGDVVEDMYENCGPLGGIHASLSATSTDLNLMLSVDMPRMTSEFLKWLLERAGASPELIIVPHAAGGPQPLRIADHKRAAPPVDFGMAKTLHNDFGADAGGIAHGDCDQRTVGHTGTFR